MTTATFPAYCRGNAAHAWAIAFRNHVATAAITIAANSSTAPAYLHQLLTSARATAFTLGQPRRGQRTMEALKDAAAIWAEVHRLADGKPTGSSEETDREN